ncbi:MAG TPA: carboxypeptidase regulatory-like domain-containing protein [Phycisphaerae bacterium]|nr:carboxypeptidase regulatory-like domain-containing protein [Phycisphaerae bacterium]
MTDTLHSLLTSPLINRLGWTLLHSLWQLAAIALLAAILLQLAAHRSAAARYLLASAAYTLMPLALIITFLALAPETPATSSASTAVSVTTPTSLPAPLHLAHPANSPAFPSPVTPQLPASPSIPPAVPIAHRLAPLLPPLAVTLWLLGILLLSLRNLGAWIALLRLRSLSTPAPLLLQNRLASLAARLRLSRPLALATTTLIPTPMALGHLRPLILVPAATLLQLPPDHLEAILAHELAHIRRHDYLLNLLQTLLDTLLFYHPAAWWLSRHIRTERELACDDLAAATCGNPTLYAHALLSLEESRPPHPPRLSLAATTPNLLHRIRRLVSPLPLKSRPIPLTAILLTLAAITLPLLLPLAHAQTAPTTQPTPTTTGQLLSPSNTPVPNATVFLLGPAPNQPLLASTTTSSTGHFSLPATSDPREIFAALANVGFTSPVPAPYDAPLSLHLAPAIDVQVSLQLPDGSPAANIPVRPTFIIFPSPQGPIGPLVSLPDSLSQKLALTTDAAGHALFHGLPAAATVRFDIDDPRFAHIAPVFQAPLQGDPALIRITLPKLLPAAAISGRLLNPETHQPLPGITLLAQDANPTGSSGAATTDAQGDFTISRLPPGNYSLSLNQPDDKPLDFVAPALTIPLTTGGQTTADLHLSRGALIRGQVLDEQTGQPVAGVPIGAYGSARPRRAGPVYRRISDAQGRFQFRLPPGEQTLFVQTIPDDYLPLPQQGMKTLTLTEGQTPDITFNLPPDPAPLVEGAILGPDNKPVPGATITAGGRKFATADKDGKFHLHANPGALLHVAANGLNTVDPITVPQDQPLTIHLQKNATFNLSVTIVDESLHPVPTASLVLTTTLGNHATSSAPHPADSAATVHIDKLPLDGAYTIEAQAPGFGVSSQQIHQFPHGDPYDTTIVLYPRTAQIAGTVVDSTGNPAPNITVAMNGAATGAAETKTDANGHFSFPVPEKSSALISLPSVHVTPGTSHKSNAGDTDVHLTYPASPPSPAPANPASSPSP